MVASKDQRDFNKGVANNKPGREPAPMRRGAPTPNHLPRDPLCIVYKTDDLSFYRTFVSAVNHAMMQVMDASVVNAARSFGVFRAPLYKAYERLIPILIQEEDCFRSNNPIPRTQFLHSLAVTMNPGFFEMVIKFVYEDGLGFHRHYTIRAFPKTLNPAAKMIELIKPEDRPHPRLPAKI